jgi:hypothetical protein
MHPPIRARSLWMPVAQVRALQLIRPTSGMDFIGLAGMHAPELGPASNRAIASAEWPGAARARFRRQPAHAGRCPTQNADSWAGEDGSSRRSVGGAARSAARRTRRPQSADEAASCAHRSLPAKNTLTADDAPTVSKQAFGQARGIVRWAPPKRAAAGRRGLARGATGQSTPVSESPQRLASKAQGATPETSLSFALAPCCGAGGRQNVHRFGARNCRR